MDLTLIPLVLVLAFAVAMASVWAWALALAGFGRSVSYLGLLALGYGVFGVAIAAQYLTTPPLVAAALYASGAMLVSYGILFRSGFVSPPPLLVLFGVAIPIGVAIFSYLEDNVLMRVYVVNFGLGAIFLYPAWRLRRMARGTEADRLLFWVLLIVGLHFFPRILLTASAITSSDASRVANSPFWIVTFYSGALFTTVLGLGIMLSAALDLIARLKAERDTDALTEVYNRRGTDARLREIVERTGRRAITVIMCDIDHFKQVNDRHGHGAGDRVLRHFADVLRDNISPDDFVGRLGGEEFVVVAAGTEPGEGVGLAERIRMSVETTDWQRIVPQLSLTCSLGVTEIRPQEDPWGAVRRADELLYAAKRRGRNCSVSDDEAIWGGREHPGIRQVNRDDQRETRGISR